MAKKKNIKTFLPSDQKCPVCGKVFVPAPEHIFKVGSKWFDRWSCYSKYVTEADKHKRQGKKRGERNGG